VASAGVLLGAVDAVSGASATITGLKPYVGATVIGPTSLSTTVPAGVTNLTLRIIVANPGSDHLQDYWNCYPLPPGLTINTNYGGSGYITNVPGQVTVEGVYNVTLLAGNQNFGYITTNATIAVTNSSAGSAPSITTQPQSLTVTNGDPASFMVVATGSPSPTYQWRKNGTNLNGAVAATYSIAAATTNDVGSYDVVAGNSFGTVTSSPPATLTVLVPPSIVTQPQSLTVTNGGDAVFTVEASGTQPLTYQWKLNGTDRTGATSPTLIITNVQSTDSGDYTVSVSNAVSTAVSLPAHLTVQVPSLAQLKLSGPQWTNGNLGFDITGPVQTNFVVWTSITLSNWVTLKTNFSIDGTWRFVDTNSAAGNVRFYRATVSP
jgi:hypothetical protein